MFVDGKCIFCYNIKYGGIKMRKTLRKTICILLAAVLLLSSAFIHLAFAGYSEITERTPLLDGNSKLTQTGWCPVNLFDFSRKDYKGNPFKLKEWDFYQVSNDRYTMQITIADISIAGAVCVTVFDMETGDRIEQMLINLFTFGRMGMKDDAMAPHSYKFKRGNFDLSVDVTEEKRTIVFKGKKDSEDFDINLTLDMLPEHESLTMAVPFEKDSQFYLNQKINCMAATGTIDHGDTHIEFKGKEDNSYCVLDWGRGVWPYHQVWWWGNGSTTLEDGSIFGFEIGWGFGNTDEGIENCLFYNGKAHKIGKITLVNQKEVTENWTGTDWILTSEDGRFEMTMTPFFDNFTKTRVVFVGNICHQVFGKFNGTVTLDDGTVLEIKDMTAFIEQSDNMW